MLGRKFAMGVPVCALFVISAFVGCSKNDDHTGPSSGTVVLHMTDAPKAVQAVNLVITEVSINPSGNGSDNGWEVLRSDSMNVDLLSLQNGVFTTLASGRVAAGTYDQVRLKLGAGSTIMVDGVTYPLTVPSGMQSGLKIIGPFTVPNGGTADISLDFDASRSIIQTGNGTYILKPVVRVMPTSIAGSIQGQVLPTTTQTTVFAIQAAYTVGSAVTGTNGNFAVSVLPAGTYSVAFHPSTGFRDTTLTGVNVTSGHATNVGTVQLTPQ